MHKYCKVVEYLEFNCVPPKFMAKFISPNAKEEKLEYSVEKNKRQ